MKPTVLLAAYNGLPYLKELIASLQNQTIPFSCLIQDDGSSDGTMDVLRKLTEEDSRFTLSAACGQHLGAAANFLSLLQQSEGPVACCDQDDIWEPDRLELGMKALEEAEARLGKGTPILVSFGYHGASGSFVFLPKEQCGTLADLQAALPELEITPVEN